MELLDYEKKHIEYIKKNASECTLFLKKNDEFPISHPCKVALFGCGARHTIKGGTGSGDVASRFFKTIEEEFIDRGYEVVTKKWLDSYDEFKVSTKKDYIKEVKRKARKVHILAPVYSMGYFEEEKDYDIKVDEYEADICIYVLARNSGEGNDRRNIKGDVKLSNKEIEDINFLNKKFKKFMLVLNVGGVVDLTPVMDVSNILLLSQLGVVTSSVLVDIIKGNSYPSGKLSTTWAPLESYPCFNEFGDRDDTYYKEGIYVGYRYFNTKNVDTLFPFGFGLSYTNFDIKFNDARLDKKELVVKCSVINIGAFYGKEVVELYVTKPNTILDNPYLELCAYAKTKELKPGDEETVELRVDLSTLSNYDEERAYTILQKGDYIFRIGNSSNNLEAICKCHLDSEVVLEKLDNKCPSYDITDLVLDRIDEDTSNLLKLDIDETLFNIFEAVYKKDTYTDSLIETLETKDLANMCLGHHDGGIGAIVGESCKHVVGGAGETTLSVEKVDKSLTMADGPAGLRITQEYFIDKKGVHNTKLDPLMEKLVDFLPKISYPFIKPKKYKGGELYHQYTTAIPIGTALAQSFSDDFVLGCAKVVKEEMDIFNVDLWLAPALNIHRNILCGRNFEYFSEDPYVAGRVSATITKGIEEDGKRGVTIKHFACNNQEFNRNNNNSHISERALREIYLKGFELCIKCANPKAIMTSYNLINGVHTSESFDLVNDILRCEWGYEGLVMTDWIVSGRSFCKKSIYLAPYASNNILAGNDLTMSGCKKDYKDIMKAIKSKKLSREDLIYSASRIYRSILKQKDIK